ncbi:F-box-like domain-containing protein [Purpureocillium lilacinum]|uniref:F-box-like domain-containing protein n=1 Tax=Purpureocillium lilacinum TaxID=33203 RepID=A0A179HE18_PURLI|nr:hypothetical protein Purlil1_6235 [Purpureocillium lilacinum]OAQ87770.1 F-box-like domain-containing protein [Purpureocillium lilacinum]
MGLCFIRLFKCVRSLACRPALKIGDADDDERKKPAPAGWNSLPLELCIQVWQHLADSGEPLASYATVCREWQRHLEKHTFGTLNVKSSDIDTFRDVVRGERRTHVRRINLIIELPDKSVRPARQSFPPGLQDPGPFWTTGVPALVVREMLELTLPGLREKALMNAFIFSQRFDNNVAFTHSLWFFFDVLSLWDPHDDASPLGLAVYIIAPTFSLWQREAAAAKSIIQANPTLQLAGTPTDSWLPPPLRDQIIRSADRDFNVNLDWNFSQLFRHATEGSAKSFPVAPVVTSLCVPSLTVRKIAPKVLFDLLLRLPSVRDFVWEIWPHATIDDKIDFEYDVYEGLRRLECASAARRLAHIRLHQVQEYDFDRPVYLDQHVRQRCNSPELGAELALMARRLRHVEILYRVGTHPFLCGTCAYTPVAVPRESVYWETLQRLTLLLGEDIIDEAPAMDHEVLYHAVRATSRMPNLRGLVLYNANQGTDQDYALVSYMVQPDRSATICVRCTWEFELGTRLWRAWEHTGRELHFDIKRATTAETRSLIKYHARKNSAA